MNVTFYVACAISALLFGVEAFIGKKNSNPAEVGAGIGGVVMSLIILIASL